MAADYLNDTSQFDLARKRVQQQSASTLQSRKDALARRFAALGNLESGARMKIEQQAMDEEAQNAAQANEGIDAAQNAEMGRRREILQAQEFARGERLGSQSFGAEQSALQRAWGTGEREAGQKYGTGEREAAQLFAVGEREAGQEYQTGVLGKQQQFATAEREAMVRAQADAASKDRAFTKNENTLARKQQASQFGVTSKMQAQQISIARDQLAASMDQFNKQLEYQREADKQSLQAYGQANSGRNLLTQANQALTNIGTSTGLWS